MAWDAKVAEAERRKWWIVQLSFAIAVFLGSGYLEYLAGLYACDWRSYFSCAQRWYASMTAWVGGIAAFVSLIWASVGVGRPTITGFRPISLWLNALLLVVALAGAAGGVWASLVAWDYPNRVLVTVYSDSQASINRRVYYIATACGLAGLHFGHLLGITGALYWTRAAPGEAAAVAARGGADGEAEGVEVPSASKAAKSALKRGSSARSGSVANGDEKVEVVVDRGIGGSGGSPAAVEFDPNAQDAKMVTELEVFKKYQARMAALTKQVAEAMTLKEALELELEETAKNFAALRGDMAGVKTLLVTTETRNRELARENQETRAATNKELATLRDDNKRLMEMVTKLVVATEQQTAQLKANAAAAAAAAAAAVLTASPQSAATAVSPSATTTTMDSKSRLSVVSGSAGGSGASPPTPIGGQQQPVLSPPRARAATSIVPPTLVSPTRIPGGSFSGSASPHDRVLDAKLLLPSGLPPLQALRTSAPVVIEGAPRTPIRVDTNTGGSASGSLKALASPSSRSGSVRSDSGSTSSTVAAAAVAAGEDAEWSAFLKEVEALPLEKQSVRVNEELQDTRRALEAVTASSPPATGAAGASSALTQEKRTQFKAKLLRLINLTKQITARISAAAAVAALPEAGNTTVDTAAAAAIVRPLKVQSDSVASAPGNDDEGDAKFDTPRASASNATAAAVAGGSVVGEAGPAVSVLRLSVTAPPTSNKPAAASVTSSTGELDAELVKMLNDATAETNRHRGSIHSRLGSGSVRDTISDRPLGPPSSASPPPGRAALPGAVPTPTPMVAPDDETAAFLQEMEAEMKATGGGSPRLPTTRPHSASVLTPPSTSGSGGSHRRVMSAAQKMQKELAAMKTALLEKELEDEQNELDQLEKNARLRIAKREAAALAKHSADVEKQMELTPSMLLRQFGKEREYEPESTAIDVWATAPYKKDTDEKGKGKGKAKTAVVSSDEGWLPPAKARCISFELVWAQSKWHFERRDTIRTFARRKQPFARGAMRMAYYAIDTVTGQRFVLKRSRFEAAHCNTVEYLLADVETQLICKRLACDYQKELSKLVKANWKNFEFIAAGIIDFNITSAAEVKTAGAGDPLLRFGFEPVLVGKFAKYTNNGPHIDADADPIVKAFSHYTYHASDKTLMAVDLQGVNLLASDPQLHAVDKSRFGEGNRSEKGFADYFGAHACNDVCKRLKLEPHPTQTLPATSEGAFIAFPKEADRQDDTALGYDFVCGCGQSFRPPTVATCAVTLELRVNKQEVMCPDCADEQPKGPKRKCVACGAKFPVHRRRLIARNLEFPPRYCSKEACDAARAKESCIRGLDFSGLRAGLVTPKLSSAASAVASASGGSAGSPAVMRL